jgi:hypothetical protein
MTQMTAPGRAEVVDELVVAAHRMRVPLSTRQAAALLKVAEDRLRPADAAREKRRGRGRSGFPHGTVAGYKRHLRAKERACFQCREACRLYAAERRSRQPRRELQPCGTLAAYHRHLRRFEEPCEPCKEAKRTYHRDYKIRQRSAA